MCVVQFAFFVFLVDADDVILMFTTAAKANGATRDVTFAWTTTAHTAAADQRI